MAVKQVPLEDLPVAKGRPRTRRCWACGESKPLAEFVAAPGAPRPRRCSACVARGKHQLKRKTKCTVCGLPFIAHARNAKTCSNACAHERELAMQRRRRNEGST